MNIIINGSEYCKVNSLKSLKQILFELIDIEISPLEALKANMVSLFDLIEQFCKMEKENKKGSKRAQLTREITKINNQRKF